LQSAFFNRLDSGNGCDWCFLLSSRLAEDSLLASTIHLVRRCLGSNCVAAVITLRFITHTNRSPRQSDVRVFRIYMVGRCVSGNNSSLVRNRDRCRLASRHASWHVHSGQNLKTAHYPPSLPAKKSRFRHLSGSRCCLAGVGSRRRRCVDEDGARKGLPARAHHLHSAARTAHRKFDSLI